VSDAPTRALAIAAAVRARQLRARDVVESALQRIATVDPVVNSFTDVLGERARAEAERVDAAVAAGRNPGPLAGVPFAVKNLFDVAGIRTLAGSKIYRERPIAARDAAAVRALSRAGAVLVGALNMDEYACGFTTENTHYGPTHNPHDLARVAGGSSGGSAAALACDMLPVCTGSDTGGSLRIPAALCGVVGFRPSPGLVPSSRKLLGWTPISVVGPMGRTVADACLQMAASAGASVGDPLSYPVDPASFLEPPAVNLGALRVGWTEDFGACDVDASIREVFRRKIAAMKHLFRSCDELNLDLGDVHRCFDVLRAEAFVAGTRDAYERDPTSLGPNTRANFEIGAAMSLLDSAWAQAEQTRILARFNAAMADCDFILVPTTPVSPFPWTMLYADTVDGKPQGNYYRWLALTYVVTLTTLPALSLPCGLDHAGMPFGLQLIGRFRADHHVLGIAAALEQAFANSDELRRPRPALERLRCVEPALTSIVTAPPLPGGAPGRAVPPTSAA